MYSFNPCFNGSVERGKVRSKRHRATQDVSILVLMEVLREAGAGIWLYTRTNRFNPCFNGSVERGKAEPARRITSRQRFNPCFNGSVERGASAEVNAGTMKKFQSLF